MNDVSNLRANETIYDAIRQIAFHKLINPRTNTLKNTSRTSGFVVKFHDDPSDELFGTVDVQEYNLGSETNRQAVEDGLPVGLHEGVYLSALQHNEKGLVTIPYLYSDVVIATDPETLREYVIQYSHADTVQVDAHNKVVIGVTETEEYQDTEDSPDVDELEPTGVHAHTTYTPISMLSVVGKSDKPEEQSSLELTAEKIEVSRDKGKMVMDAEQIHTQFDEKASTTLNAEKFEAKYDKAQLLMDAQQLLAKYDAKEIVIKSYGVYVGSGSASEPAVLGNQLASLLVEWLGALSSMMTPTMMGPQPPANVAQFVSLQAKVNSYKAATSGILSKTVKIAQ